MDFSNSQRESGGSSWLKRLSRRERFLVTGCLIFVACFLFFQLVVDPFLARKQRLHRSLQQKTGEVLEMQLLQQQYQQISGNKKEIMAQLQRRRPDFSLFTFVEEQIEGVRLKQRVTSLKPAVSAWQEGIRQATIEIKIERIVLAQLVDFLLAIESFEMVVFVDRLLVQNNRREDGLLDVMLSVTTFENQPAS